MNQNDFMIWLKGFLDAIPESQSPQWKILKDKIKEINVFPVPQQPLFPSYPLEPYYNELFRITCEPILCQNTSSTNSTTQCVVTFKKVPYTLTNKK